jgi:hypothetical protein
MFDTTLGALIMAGRATELDYMSPEDAAACLDRASYIESCSEDELADAADFIATAVRAERNDNVRI